MKRKILIPVNHDYTCADCTVSFNAGPTEWFDEEGKPLCFQCAMTCDFCDDFTFKVVVVRNGGHSRILCLECAQISKEAL